MTTHTMTLREVIKFTGSDGFGLNTYPIFNEGYRAGLNEKIRRRYLNREIGLENIDQFTFNLETRMFEIMPLYNQLYESEKIQFDPLSTVDLSTLSDTKVAQKTESDGSTETTSDSNSTSRSVNSDTPQTMLSRNKDYATSGVDVSGDTVAKADSSEASTIDSTSDQIGNSRMHGYQGVASELLMRYRASLMNIDLNVVNELDDLFMQVFSNGDQFSDRYTLERYGV